jgi:hypothetical protein
MLRLQIDAAVVVLFELVLHDPQVLIQLPLVGAIAMSCATRLPPFANLMRYRRVKVRPQIHVLSNASALAALCRLCPTVR